MPKSRLRTLAMFLFISGLPLCLVSRVQGAAQEPVIISDGSVCVANPALAATAPGSGEARIPDLVRKVRLEFMSSPADSNCESPDPPCTGPDCRELECRRCTVTVTYFLTADPNKEFTIAMRKPASAARTHVTLTGKKYGDFAKVGAKPNLRLGDAKIRSIEVQGQPKMDCQARPCRVTVSFETTP